MNMDMVIMAMLIIFMAGAILFLLYIFTRPDLYSLIISSDVLDMKQLLSVIHEHGFKLYEIRRTGDFSDQEDSGLRRLTLECPRDQGKRTQLIAAIAHLPGINSVSEV